MRRIPALALLPFLAGCSTWLFSGEPRHDLSRPVVLVETTGGIELGASTEFGILTLGRTAEDGPCRVHYFLGPTPMADDGVLRPTTSVFTRAVIDLRTQNVRILERPVTPDDELYVLWTPDGESTREVEVELAHGPGIEGDVLRWPGEHLPAGAAVLRHNGHDYGPDFVGLISGMATIDAGPLAGRYYVFAGPDRMRELLAIPEKHPVDLQPHYRPDGITVMRPVEEKDPETVHDEKK